MYLPKPILKKHLLRLLEADLGMGDITTNALCGEELSQAVIISKNEPSCILAGVEEVEALAEIFEIRAEVFLKDGDEINQGDIISRLVGKAKDLLALERTALNLMMRMSAIATMTKKMQGLINQVGSRSRIAATRKTLPGFIYFDKKAVAIGGGDTHRLHLEDMVLIKDNHIILAGGIEKALKRVKDKVSFSKKIEIEVKNETEAVQAARLGADIVMLDNFSPLAVKQTISLFEKEGLRERVLIEVSGNINEQNVVEYAKANPDIISCGALTHSVKAVDMSMKLMIMD